MRFQIGTFSNSQISILAHFSYFCPSFIFHTMESFLIKAAQLLLSLSILVIIHELGHFLTARLFKIRVNKFYLFFDAGFALFRYKPKKSQTEYGIGWLPLGGYVKIAGMIDESLDTAQMAQPVQSWEFRSKPAWQRLLVMIAGVTMNFILALFIYSMIMFKWGDAYIDMQKSAFNFSEIAQKAGFQDGDIILSADGKKIIRYDDVDFIRIIDAKQVTVLRAGSEVTLNLPSDFMQQFMSAKTSFGEIITPTVIDSIIPNTPAAHAGLQKGDSLVSINNQETASHYDFVTSLRENKSKEIQLGFYRNDSLHQLAVNVSELGQLGFSNKYPPVSVKTFGFLESIPAGIDYGVKKLSSYIRQLKLIFTKEGAENLGGFVTIGSLFPEKWNWKTFWEMTAFLSLILAFMNILPIPALDGGHVLFLLYEMIARRKPSEKVLINAQIVGMILLLGLLLVANGNDVYRLIFE